MELIVKECFEQIFERQRQVREKARIAVKQWKLFDVLDDRELIEFYSALSAYPEQFDPKSRLRLKIAKTVDDVSLCTLLEYRTTPQVARAIERRLKPDAGAVEEEDDQNDN
jgi:hypothetical protein